MRRTVSAPVLQAMRTLGFTPEVVGATATRTPAAGAGKALVAAGCWPGLAALAAEAVGWIGAAKWLAAALAIAAIAGCGLSTYRKGWIAIRNGNLNINALMSIAVTGARAAAALAGGGHGDGAVHAGRADRGACRWTGHAMPSAA